MNKSEILLSMGIIVQNGFIMVLIDGILFFMTRLESRDHNSEYLCQFWVINLTS